MRYVIEHSFGEGAPREDFDKAYDGYEQVLDEFKDYSIERHLLESVFPAQNDSLRDRLFNEICTILPPSCFPFREYPAVLDVTQADVDESSHIMHLSPFPGPSESECENGTVDFSDCGSSCSKCHRKYLQSGNVRMIKPIAFKKSKPIIQLPNKDLFCVSEFIELWKKGNLTGLSFSPTELSPSNEIEVFQARIAEHEWQTKVRCCEVCQAIAIPHYSLLINTAEVFQYDIQRVTLQTGDAFILSPPAFRSLQQFKEGNLLLEYCMPIRRGLELNLRERS